MFVPLRRLGVQERARLSAQDGEARGILRSLQGLRALLDADGALVAYLLDLLRADQEGRRRYILVTEADESADSGRSHFRTEKKVALFKVPLLHL